MCLSQLQDVSEKLNRACGMLEAGPAYSKMHGMPKRLGTGEETG